VGKTLTLRKSFSLRRKRKVAFGFGSSITTILFGMGMHKFFEICMTSKNNPSKEAYAWYKEREGLVKVTDTDKPSRGSITQSSWSGKKANGW